MPNWSIWLKEIVKTIFYILKYDIHLILFYTQYKIVLALQSYAGPQSVTTIVTNMAKNVWQLFKI